MIETKAYDLSTESALLSCFINDTSMFGKYINRIKVEVFHRQRNRLIFRTMKNLFSNNDPLDIVSIKNYMCTDFNYESEDELITYLNDITDIVICPTKDLIEKYLSVLIGQYQVRQKERMAYHILQITKNRVNYDKVKEILHRHNVLTIQDEQNVPYSPESMGNIIKSTNKLDELAIEKGEKRNQGLKTGFVSLKNYIRFRPKNTYCIAGRPSMGKTSISLKIILNLIMQGYKVMLISLEMSKEELMEKLISYTQRITNDDFHKLNPVEQIKRREKLEEYLGKYSDNLIIDDYSVRLDEIKNSVYNMHRVHGLDFVVADYLQLITLNGSISNRNQEVTAISRTFKSDISTRLHLPVLLLSQLNRGVESRKNKRPILSDLRESGSLEQDFTSVMFLYRAYEYGIKLDKNGMKTKNKAELLIAKNRFGPKGIITLGFIPEYALFQDMKYKGEK